MWRVASQAAPWYALPPDFIATLTALPPAIPCSALKFPVDTLTAWIASAGGT
jgi:hypothetical protein